MLFADEYRREIKYTIPVESFYNLRNYLENYLEPDQHSNDTGYTVRSLYYDSFNNRDLLDVLDGLMEKRKIRLRIYSVDSPVVKLEYKCKSGLDVNKMVLTLSREEALCMTHGDYGFLLAKRNSLATSLYCRLKTGGYRPKVIVNYNRLAYIYTPNDTRITFDSNINASMITSGFFDENAAWKPVTQPGVGVLEVKYRGFLFGHLKKAVELIDSMPNSSSKYAISRISHGF